MAKEATGLAGEAPTLSLSLSLSRTLAKPTKSLRLS